MRASEEKGNCIHGESKGNSPGGFEGKKTLNRASHRVATTSKLTPSKWDDAQKWLVGFSRGSANQPRNSNADDRRLIIPAPPAEYFSSSDGEEDIARYGLELVVLPDQIVQTKTIDFEESVRRISKPGGGDSPCGTQSICVRDMGTEMTPIASQEPSRTATPVKSRTPAPRSPVSTPSVPPPTGWKQTDAATPELRKSSDQTEKIDPFKTKTMIWVEAERARYTSRHKREEMKIEAWENHEKRKAEMEMKRMEVKVERMKRRAQERYEDRLAANRRIAEERRANAEAKFNENAARMSERADHMRRTGRLPSFFFRLRSSCW